MSGINCVNSNSICMFKNRIDNYLVRAGYTWIRTLRTQDKPTASMSAAIGAVA